MATGNRQADHLHLVVDRRRTPDRRAFWRGGRRDTDWLNRPLSALAPLPAKVKSWFRWWPSANTKDKSPFLHF
jgi:hypothetical protein